MGHRAMIGMVVLVVALILVVYSVVRNAGGSKRSGSSLVWNPDTGRWTPIESEEKKQGRMMSTLLVILALVVFLGSVMVSEGLVKAPMLRTMSFRLSVISYFGLIAATVSASLTGVGALAGIAWVVIVMGGLYLLYPILKTEESSTWAWTKFAGEILNKQQDAQIKAVQQNDATTQTDFPDPDDPANTGAKPNTE